MITALFPNMLRSVMSNIMMVLFLFSLAQPKYNRKTLLLLSSVPLIVDISVSFYFYLQNDYTSLAKFDVVLVVVLCLVSKPLFHDTFMQWIFNFITAANVFMSIVVLSYLFSRPLLYPVYANTVIRFILFLSVILLFHKNVKPIYRIAAKHWSSFLLTVFAFFIN